MRVLDPKRFRLTSGEPVPEADIAAALDAGDVQIAMMNGKWWSVRRNGITQHWKRTPERFRIPIKSGLHVYGAITQADLVEA